MQLYAGTSGYNYDAWKGSFYPEKLAKSKMLQFYATQFSTVEINYTFYRMPNEKTLVNWSSQVPEQFRFALKASQRITHQKRLVNCEEDLKHFIAVSQALGAQRGPILFQLPPNLKCDLPRLHSFLELLPSGIQAAFEFRHASWLVDDVYRALGDVKAALCIADTDDLETPLIKTASFGYFRLRREDYAEKTIKMWSERIRSLAFEGDVFVYFKHEDDALGTKFARILLQN